MSDGRAAYAPLPPEHKAYKFNYSKRSLCWLGSAQVAATDTNHGRSPRNSLSHLGDLAPPCRIFWRSRRRPARRWTRGQESPPTRRRREGRGASQQVPRRDAGRDYDGSRNPNTPSGPRIPLAADDHFCCEACSGSDEQRQINIRRSLEIEIRSVPCVTAARAAMHRDSFAGSAVLSYCWSALPLLALQRASRGPVGATRIIK